jgi:hypothetical protein
MIIYEGNLYHSTYTLDSFNKWNSSIGISQKWVFSVRLHLEKLKCKLFIRKDNKYI